MAEKLPWHHSCAGKPFCGRGWHVDRLETDDSIDEHAIAEMLRADWDVHEVRLQELGPAPRPGRTEYLVWFRAKQR